MRRLLTLSLLALAVPALCPADSIVTGTLDFNCNCITQGNVAATIPSNGSFSYDVQDKQFLTFTFNWDGMSFVLGSGGSVPGRDDKSAYLDLIGRGSSPLLWTAICAAGQEPPFGFCGGQFDFLISNSTFSFILPVVPLATTPEFSYDAASGTLTATNLHDPVTIPEPSVWILVSMALVLVGFAAWRWIPRRKLSPPVIMTDYGPVTEWARKQAETNMRLDPEVRRQVEMQLADKYGSLEMGKRIARERYPEAYED